MRRRQLLNALGSGSLIILANRAFGSIDAHATRSAAAVRIKRIGQSVVLSNDFVMARFTPTPTGIGQNYFAAFGKDWVPLASDSLGVSSDREDVVPLYRDEPTQYGHRISVAKYLKTLDVVRHRSLPVIKLSGQFAGIRVIQLVSLGNNDSHFHIDISARLPEAHPTIDYLLSSFLFTGSAKIDFTYTPHLKRTADDVAPDRVFYSPAAILQANGALAALIPDLDVLNDDVVLARGARSHTTSWAYAVPENPDRISLPAFLDIELQSGLSEEPVFSFGFADYRAEPHVFFRHDNAGGAMTRTLSSNQLHFAFELMLAADAPLQRGYQRVAHYIWNRYGQAYLRKPLPQVMPLAEYARICLPATMAYSGDTRPQIADYDRGIAYDSAKGGSLATWQEFELNGERVGGIRSTFIELYNDIQFMSWWNNARDAVGLYWWGKKSKDDSLVRKAQLIVNLALQAPQQQGLFPGVFRLNERRWLGTYWNFGETFRSDWKLHDPVVPGGPLPEDYENMAYADAPDTWTNNSPLYQTAAASLTSAYLLQFRELCEADARILPFVIRYGDFLISRMAADGSVPAWFTSDMKPSPVLSFNADNGVHIRVLAELYKATDDQKYLEAAERAADFLRDKILPEQRWYDFETFFSCSSKPLNFYDSHSGQWPRNTLSMMWAIHGLAVLTSITRNPAHLELGEAIADYSLFFQASWQPHFMRTAYVFGGFGTQNSDAEWLDGRSSGFAEALIALASVSNRQDLYERAVAALHASFSVVSLARNTTNGVLPYPLYPTGIGPENVDHGGFSQMPYRSGYDSAEGGALNAAAEIQRHCGGLYVDFSRAIGIGIDGVRIDGFRREEGKLHIEFTNQFLKLPEAWNAPFETTLRIVGLEKGHYELVLNGAPPVEANDTQLAGWPLVIAIS